MEHAVACTKVAKIMEAPNNSATLCMRYAMLLAEAACKSNRVYLSYNTGGETDPYMQLGYYTDSNLTV